MVVYVLVLVTGISKPEPIKTVLPFKTKQTCERYLVRAKKELNIDVGFCSKTKFKN
jgi:hypothetical protein